MLFIEVIVQISNQSLAVVDVEQQQNQQRATFNE
jgi:hypothetical protein